MNERSLLVSKSQLLEHDGSEIVIFQNLLEFAEFNYRNFFPIINFSKFEEILENSVENAHVHGAVTF